MESVPDEPAPALEEVTEYTVEEANKRLETLENQELDSSSGQLSAELYTEFLAMYLLTKDLLNCKLLWKRIPLSIKTSNEALKAVWEVAKATWKHNYSEIHAKIDAFEWEDSLKRIMTQFKRNIREHCFNLVAGGYSMIKLTYLSNILGFTDAETIDAAQKREWTYLNDNGVIKPIVKKEDVAQALKNQEHLQKLTQHILFLET